MPAQPIGPQPAPTAWHPTSAVCNRSYMVAGLRAGVVVLVLLAILVVVVLF